MAAAPSIAVDDVTGRGVVGWSEFAQEGDSTVAYLQRFDDGGMPDGDPVDAFVPSGVEQQYQNTASGRSACGRSAMHAHLALCA